MWLTTVGRYCTATMIHRDWLDLAAAYRLWFYYPPKRPRLPSR